MLIQWKPPRFLAMVSGLPGQVRKKAARVRISVCRDQAGEVSALRAYPFFYNLSVNCLKKPCGFCMSSA